MITDRIKHIVNFLDICSYGFQLIFRVARYHSVRIVDCDYVACKEDPQSHDLRGDGCRSKGGDYQSALSDLESKMDDLDGRLRTVQNSCGYEFSINRMSSLEAAKRRQVVAEGRLCASYKALIGSGAGAGNVLQVCKSNMGEAWCNVCLGLK